MFFFAENLSSQAVTQGDPWLFVPTETITAQIRGDKDERQNWYANSATKHSFYTAIEGVNPNMRPSKENSPHRIHAFCADYDIAIPPARVTEAVAMMKVKPTWVERSLGGNVRLVWVLENALLVDDYGFCVFILEQAMGHLQLGLLPALDEPAFKTPTRLLANGCDWTATGAPPINAQAFFVECGRKFRFRPANEADIPLDKVEAELRARFPGFNWPSEFAPETQGPSFWIAGSVSPLSAILKPTGIFTFSAHATKPFYSWADILGAEWVRNFEAVAVTKATSDVWWDSKRFWRRIAGLYDSLSKDEMVNFLKVDCSLSSKPGKSGVAPLEVALSHVYNHNRIKAAVPFVFRPSGLIDFMGERMLNTYINRAVQPASGEQHWGQFGNFPFISLLLDSLFDPPEQLPHFLAWWQYYYGSAFNQTPLPGQNLFLMGGVGTGKTLINRHVIGGSVGGFVDAADFLVDGGTFNSHILQSPHWCLDDDTPNGTPQASARMHALFKKTAANQQHLCQTKFEKSGMLEWMGRIGCTTNLDYVSSRIVGPMDNSSLDKTCLFRCSAESRIVFPARIELMKIITRELPYFLRWLLDWQPPEICVSDPRFGYRAFHEPSLLDQSRQSSSIAPFKELLVEALDEYFRVTPESRYWRGTALQLMRLLSNNPYNEFIVRSIKLETVNRYLEQVQKEGMLKCASETGDMNSRIWLFQPLPHSLTTPKPIFK